MWSLPRRLASESGARSWRHRHAARPPVRPPRAAARREPPARHRVGGGGGWGRDGVGGWEERAVHGRDAHGDPRRGLLRQVREAVTLCTCATASNLLRIPRTRRCEARSATLSMAGMPEHDTANAWTRGSYSHIEQGPRPADGRWPVFLARPWRGRLGEALPSWKLHTMATQASARSVEVSWPRAVCSAGADMVSGVRAVLECVRGTPIRHAGVGGLLHSHFDDLCPTGKGPSQGVSQSRSSGGRSAAFRRTALSHYKSLGAMSREARREVAANVRDL